MEITLLQHVLEQHLLVQLGMDTLGSLGYDVVGRTSSLEALELFRARPGRFDLVITDMTMPSMTGVELAQELVEVVCRVSGLENGGVLGDSSPNRNDYRCKNTGKLSFYSLDENVNPAPVRVLLEIGDNKISYDLLMDPEIQKKIGKAIQDVVELRFGKTGT